MLLVIVPPIRKTGERYRYSVFANLLMASPIISAPRTATIPSSTSVGKRQPCQTMPGAKVLMTDDGACTCSKTDRRMASTAYVSGSTFVSTESHPGKLVIGNTAPERKNSGI